MLLKLLSPASVLAGLIAAALALVALWPVDKHATGVAVMAFAVGAGLFELVRRLRSPTAPTSTTHSEGK